jgi:hypothetical protein
MLKAITAANPNPIDQRAIAAVEVRNLAMIFEALNSGVGLAGGRRSQQKFVAIARARYALCLGTTERLPSLCRGQFSAEQP